MSESIQTLSQEGQLDSQGKFTLDTRSAMLKLREKLLQPEDCLLYLLQSAVASGATWFKVKSGAGEVVISHDGLFPKPEEAGDLLGWALESVSPSLTVARHRLGMALASSLTPPGQGLRLEYPDGESLHLLPNHPLKSGRLGSRPEGGQFRLFVQQSWWRRWMGTNRSATIRRLRQRGRFACLSLTIDDDPIAGTEYGKPGYGGQCYPWSDDTTRMRRGEGGRVYHCDHHVAELRIPVKVGREDYLSIPGRTSASFLLNFRSADQACSAAIAWRLNRRPCRVEVVQYGVTLAPADFHFLPPPLWILVADNQVATDLSCLKPVQTSEYTKQMEALGHQFMELFEPFQAKYSAKPREDELEVWLVDSAWRMAMKIQAASLAQAEP